MEKDTHPRAALVQDEETLKAYLAFANPILEVVEDDPYMIAEYPFERLMDEIARDRRAVFVLYAPDGEIIGGAMTKIMDAPNKRMRGIDSDAPMALWEYAAIAASERGKRHIRLLNDARFEWTRQQGIHEIVGEIVTDNFRQLTVYFQAGFVATRLMPPSLGIPVPFFIVRKSRGASPVEPSAQHHLLSAVDAVPFLELGFELGYVVTGIRRLCSTPSENPFDWFYVMQHV